MPFASSPFSTCASAENRRAEKRNAGSEMRARRALGVRVPVERDQAARADRVARGSRGCGRRGRRCRRHRSRRGRRPARPLLPKRAPGCARPALTARNLPCLPAELPTRQAPGRAWRSRHRNPRAPSNGPGPPSSPRARVSRASAAPAIGARGPTQSGATCSSKPSSTRFHQLACGWNAGNVSTRVRTGSQEDSGYTRTQPSGCAVSTNVFPPSSSASRWRVGIATRPFASSVMTAAP